MQRCEINAIECRYFKLAIKNNPPSVVIDDEAAIPAEYMREPPPPKAVPDKKKIMDDLKQGVVIDGVHAETKQSLTIK